MVSLIEDSSVFYVGQSVVLGKDNTYLGMDEFVGTAAIIKSFIGVDAEGYTICLVSNNSFPWRLSNLTANKLRVIS